jgi:hypothetical protein
LQKLQAFLVILAHTEWLSDAPYTMGKSRRVYSDLFFIAVTGFVVWGITKIMK